MIKVKKYKICRKLGTGIFDKCLNPKFALGEEKKRRRTRMNFSNFSKENTAKQKIKLTYGIRERQFRNYIHKALLKQDSVKYLSLLLESRIDNIVYRLGLAKSRRMARQMVSHGHFKINNVRITIPSYHIKSDYQISIRDGSLSKKIFTNLDNKDVKLLPKWLSFDYNKKVGSVISEPIINSEEFDFHKVLESYSK